MNNNNFRVALVLLYNLVIVALFSYIVFGLDRSGWWYLLALMFMATTYDEKS